MSARFLFAVTQAGAERPLKNEIARDHPTLRFAFSRPGFVTFRAARRRRGGRGATARLRVRTHLGLFARQGAWRRRRGARARGLASRGGTVAERRVARAPPPARVAARRAVCPATRTTTPSRPRSSAPPAPRCSSNGRTTARRYRSVNADGRRRRARARLRARRARRVVGRLASRRFARDSLARRRAADRAAATHDLAGVSEDRRSAAMVGAARRGWRSLRRDRQLAGRLLPRACSSADCSSPASIRPRWTPPCSRTRTSLTCGRARKT